MDESTAGSTDKNTTDDRNGEENENPTRAALGELLRTEAKLKEAVEAKQEIKRQWRQRETALRYSNWKLELELAKLRVEIDELEKEIFAKARESKKAHDHLQVYKLRNKREGVDFRTYFQRETQKYSNQFTNAHIEYSSVCLNRDIEEYRGRSEIVRGKIAHIEKEMEAAEARYGLVEIGTNEDAKLLADLDAVKKTLSDKRHVLRGREAAEETVNVLQLKVRQKRDDIAYLKNKSYKE